MHLACIINISHNIFSTFDAKYGIWFKNNIFILQYPIVCVLQAYLIFVKLSIIIMKLKQMAKFAVCMYVYICIINSFLSIN